MNFITTYKRAGEFLLENSDFILMLHSCLHQMEVAFIYLEYLEQNISVVILYTMCFHLKILYYSKCNFISW